MEKEKPIQESANAQIHKVWVFSVENEIRLLAKAFLELLEDVRSEQDSNLDKLSKIMKEEFSPVLPFLSVIDDKKFAQLRKRVLDKSNDLIRKIHNSKGSIK